MLKGICWGLVGFVFMSACGGSGGPAIQNVETPDLPVDEVTDEILAFDEEQGNVDDGAPTEPTVPVVEQPIIVETPSFQALDELQNNASDVALAHRNGDFSGPELTNMDAPVGRAFYHGIMTIRRADGYTGPTSNDFVSGQFNLTVPFNGDDMSGIARSFVYFPDGSTILGDTAGARSVLGSVSMTGNVNDTGVNPSAPIGASLSLNGSVVFPDAPDDMQNTFVSVRGPNDVSFVEGGIAFGGRVDGNLADRSSLPTLVVGAIGVTN